MRISFDTDGNVNPNPNPASDKSAAFGSADRILYRDDDILIAVKPAGIATTPAKNDPRDILSYLYDRYPGIFSSSVPKPVHRLDRPVGGLLLLTCSRRAEKFFSPDGVKRYMAKSYTAVVCGAMPQERGTLRDFIVRDKTANRSAVVPEGTTDASEALLHYETAGRIALPDGSGEGSILTIRLMTGRRHQIRVQLANAGCPIYGDTRYGYNRTAEQGGIALFAHELPVTHPVTGKKTVFTADPCLYEPQTFAFMRKTDKDA